jgi:hypothetical protein
MPISIVVVLYDIPPTENEGSFFPMMPFILSYATPSFQ